METMNDILKEIFDGFSEASRIGQRIQIAADAAMRAEREADEKAEEENHADHRDTDPCDDEDKLADRFDKMEAREAEAEERRNDYRYASEEIQPWNDDLNPQ